jgi:hypothetical protein
VALDIKDKVLSAFGINTTSTILNQQQDINNDKNQEQINRNVPAPPLANNAQRQQQPDHVESAQAAPQLLRDSKLIIKIKNKQIFLILFLFFLVNRPFK